jgi:hypothetical protein
MMNLKKLQGDRSWPIARYITSVCFEVLTIARKVFGYDTRYQGQVSELEHEEYKL